MSEESQDPHLEELDRGDRLVGELLNGALGWSEFLNQYDNLYWRVFVDDDQPGRLPVAVAARLGPHRRIADEVFTRLCSDEDAVKPMYADRGFVGSTAATELIRDIWAD